MNSSISKVLVTGGSGYFGTTVVQKLLESGRQVWNLDINAPDESLPGVEFLPCDIRDEKGVRKACHEMDAVIHCVAQVPLAKDKELFWSVNRDGTKILLDACHAASVKKVIYVSSSAVFGVPKEVPITEETVPSPAETYGAAKLAGEEACQELRDRGLDVTIVRPRTIMGHGRLGIMQIVFEWVLQGDNVFVLGRGANRYQFVHADDLVDACLRAMDRPGPATYNIGTDQFGTMRETLEGLINHAETGSRVRSLPYGLAIFGMKVTSALRLSPLGPYHSMVYGKDVYFDISKAKRELAWQPQWSNVEMFVQSYDWYVEHREEILAAKGRSAHRSAVKQGVLRILRWF